MPFTMFINDPKVKGVVDTLKAGQAITGQAVPSVSPGVAALHLQKTECFCFTQQRLEAGEAVDPDVAVARGDGSPPADGPAVSSAGDGDETVAPPKVAGADDDTPPESTEVARAPAERRTYDAAELSAMFRLLDTHREAQPPDAPPASRKRVM